MGNFTYYNNTFHLGSVGKDHLEAGPGQHAVLGLGGDDTLVSRSGYGQPSLVTLAGGQGNDTYHAGADITQIVDSGGHDKLYIPGYQEEFVGALLDGRDLILMNEWTGQTVVVFDFKGAGRIEQLIDYAGRSLSAKQVEQLIYSEGHGNISYIQMQMMTGDYSVSVHEFHAAREIDLAIPKLNWNHVFLHLEERGSLDSAAIADAIQYEVFPLLSSAARQFWESSGAYEAIKASEFHGLSEHITPPSLTPLTRGIVEQIALLYEAALDRAPDEAGLNYWLQIAEQDHGVLDIAGYFLISEEFQQAIGPNPSDTHYLDQLYLNVLDRPADSAGHHYWQEQLDAGLTRQEVLLYFAESEENRDNAHWLAGLTETHDGSWIIG